MLIRQSNEKINLQIPSNVGVIYKKLSAAKILHSYRGSTRKSKAQKQINAITQARFPIIIQVRHHRTWAPPILMLSTKMFYEHVNNSYFVLSKRNSASSFRRSAPLVA